MHTMDDHAIMKQLEEWANQDGDLTSQQRDYKLFAVCVLSSLSDMQKTNPDCRITELKKLNLYFHDFHEIPDIIGKFTALTSLDFSYSDIEQLPDGIRKLTNLTSLNLWKTSISQLPDFIFQLTKLTFLKLGSTNITQISDSICQLINLASLDLSSTKITQLPKAICNLTNLTSLDLRNTSISQLPAAFGQLTRLNFLDLSDTDISVIPESISQLKNLNTLNLGLCYISQIPDFIFNLTTLTALRLNISKEAPLPYTITRLTQLISLDLSFSNISSLPSYVCQLTNLKSLDLAHTDISQIPDSIGQLTNLESLDLADTDISQLPDSIGQLTNLQSLDLSFTDISQLPNSIGQLTNLQSLDLSFTGISQLPDSIKQLTGLKSLDISTTKISSLPECIWKFGLNRLDLSHNNYESFPSEILDLGMDFHFEECFSSGVVLYETQLQQMDINIFRKPIAEIRKYYDELKKDSKLLNEARIIFIGDGGVGKTTIIEMLKGNPYLSDRKETQGISIGNLDIPLDGETAILHLWDFGGQEIMHSTHELFLRDNCIYVIVLDGRKEDRPEYWLEFVRRYGRNSPVLLVMNKCEQPHYNVFSISDLSERYSDLNCDFEINYISCETKQNFDVLRDKIFALVKATNGYKKLWPGPWIAVKQDLENMKSSDGRTLNYINESTYYGYCEDAGIHDIEDKEMLLRWLCDLGIVFSYQSSSHQGVVEDLKVLRPEWITNGIYMIINSPLVKDYCGNIPQHVIQTILSNDTGLYKDMHYSPTERDFVLGIMRDFKMSYQLENNEFIPLLTPIDKPASLRNWKSDISIYQQFEGGVPSALVYQLIAVMSDDVDTSNTWKRGTLLSSSHFMVRALVQVIDNRLYIELQGENENSSMYLSIIQNNLSKLCGNLNLNSTEYIGVTHNDRRKYILLERMVNMLVHGKTTDYIDGDGWNCEIDLKDALRYIVPFTVMKQIEYELASHEEHIGQEKESNRKIDSILDLVYKNNTILNDTDKINNQILSYLKKINYDNLIIIQHLETFKKEIPLEHSDIMKQIDEAICEIKSGNTTTVAQIIMNLVGLLSGCVTLAGAPGNPLNLLLNLFQ